MQSARLVPQCYGIQCSHVVFGGPSGVWLECRGCSKSSKIEGSGSKSSYWMNASDEEVASVFRGFGWYGEGNKMLNAKCPECSKKE